MNRRKKEKKITTIIPVNGIILFFAHKDDGINLACQNLEWIIDSNASYFVTSYRNIFTSLQEGNHGFIKMGNKDASQILGIGDIYITTNTRAKLILKNVRYAPNVHLSLLFMEKLDEDRYSSILVKDAENLLKNHL